MKNSPTNYSFNPN